MEELSITIHIAGRQYRLKTNEKEKEQIEEAAKRINKGVKLYAEHYAYKDNQDLIAMVSLQHAVGLVKCDIGKRELDENIEARIRLMDDFLSEDNIE